jgi:hypothetical protein
MYGVQSAICYMIMSTLTILTSFKLFYQIAPSIFNTLAI